MGVLMEERPGRRAVRNPLPEGTLAVGVGLLVNGLASYGFLVLPARAGLLDAAQYASLSALWFLVFTAGPGVFLPLEQEVGRAISARRALGLGGGPVVRRAALIGAGMAAVLLAIAVAASSGLLNGLFEGEKLLLWGFLLAIPAYAAVHLARGTLSGNRRFRGYSTLIGSEGVIRLAGAAVLVILGAQTAGPYGLLMGIVPFLALALVLSRERGLMPPGPEAPWSELSAALGYLLAAQILAQLLVNAAPIAVTLLATGPERELAGRFGAGYLLARVPLFLFAAVQAALLPKLAGLAASGRHTEFRAGLKRLLVVVGGVTVIAGVGAFVAGPFAVRTLFGPEFELGRVNLTVLAVASGGFMVATTLAQALIALEAYRRVVVGWAVGVATFVLVVSFGSDLLLRAELAFLAATVTATATFAVLLATRMRDGGVPETVDPLLDAVAQEYVEP